MAKQRQSILYVDDDPDHRRLVSTALEQHGGYDVTCAANGEEGLAAARRHRPDLMLLDMMMPGADGLSVLQRMQSDADLRGTPVVFLTARALPGDVERGMAAGASDYVTKPIDLLGLGARLAAVICKAGRAADWRDGRPMTTRSSGACSRASTSRRARSVALPQLPAAWQAPDRLDNALSRGGDGVVQEHGRVRVANDELERVADVWRVARST